MDRWKRAKVRQFTVDVQEEMMRRRSGPRWLRNHAVDAVTILDRALNHIEVLEQRIKELERG